MAAKMPEADGRRAYKYQRISSRIAAPRAPIIFYGGERIMKREKPYRKNKGRNREGETGARRPR